jgi:hypothetical protein
LSLFAKEDEMAAPKRTVPPARPPVKKLSKPVSRTSMTKLVRDNLNTLTKEKMAWDKSHNETLAEFGKWVKKGRKPQDKYSDEMVKILETWEEVNPNRWTQNQLPTTIGISKTVILKVYGSSKTKKSDSIDISELIPLAVGFGVSPGYFFQPNRKQLENDSTLHIAGLQQDGKSLVINAHQWFIWVHSMGPLPGQSPEDYEVRMSQLTTEEDMKYEQPKEILTGIELQRAINASYFSPISPGISAHEVFYPGLQAEVDGKFFIEDVKQNLQPADRELAAFQNKVTFLTFSRRALRLMDDFETESDIKKAIKWSLNQMGHALAAIAVNRLKKRKK